MLAAQYMVAAGVIFICILAVSRDMRTTFSSQNCAVKVIFHFEGLYQSANFQMTL